MNAPDSPNFDATRRFEPSPDPLVGSQVQTPAVFAPPPATETSHLAGEAGVDGGREVLYVPLAVTVGDGFKFGCGFFMAFVVMLLIAFVLSTALFALTSLMGLNLPVGR